MLPVMEKSSFTRPTTNVLALSLTPSRYFLVPASGWAVIAGILAVRPWILDGGLWEHNADWLLKALLLWLLFDPILGTIWQLLIQNRLRQRLAEFDDIALHGTPSLPYITRNSAAYRWLIFWKKIRLQPAMGWQSLFLLTGLALVLGAIFGWGIFLMVVLSLGVMWIQGGTIPENTLFEQIWQMFLQFLLPFGVAIIIFGKPNLAMLLFGVAFALVFGGALRLPNASKWGEIWLIFGLAAVAILSFALFLPMAGAITVMAAGTAILFRQDVAAERYTWADKLPAFNAMLWLTLVVSAWFMGGLTG